MRCGGGGEGEQVRGGRKSGHPPSTLGRQSKPHPELALQLYNTHTHRDHMTLQYSQPVANMERCHHLLPAELLSGHHCLSPTPGAADTHNDTAPHHSTTHTHTPTHTQCTLTHTHTLTYTQRTYHDGLYSSPAVSVHTFLPQVT